MIQTPQDGLFVSAAAARWIPAFAGMTVWWGNLESRTFADICGHLREGKGQPGQPQGLPLRDNAALRVAVDILDASDGKLRDHGNVVLHRYYGRDVFCQLASSEVSVWGGRVQNLYGWQTSESGLSRLKDTQDQEHPENHYIRRILIQTITLHIPCQVVVVLDKSLLSL